MFSELREDQIHSGVAKPKAQGW